MKCSRWKIHFIMPSWLQWRSLPNPPNVASVIPGGAWNETTFRYHNCFHNVIVQRSATKDQNNERLCIDANICLFLFLEIPKKSHCSEITRVTPWFAVKRFCGRKRPAAVFRIMLLFKIARTPITLDANISAFSFFATCSFSCDVWNFMCLDASGMLFPRNNLNIILVQYIYFSYSTTIFITFFK